MKVINNIISKIKNIFSNKKQVKELPKENVDYRQKKEVFLETLKDNTNKPQKNEVTTLICEGDGLGIQENLRY